MEVTNWVNSSAANVCRWPIVSILVAKANDRYGEGERTFMLHCNRRKCAHCGSWDSSLNDKF